MDLGLLGASKMVPKCYGGTENGPHKWTLRAKMVSRGHFGAQTDPKDPFKTLFWTLK